MRVAALCNPRMKYSGSYNPREGLYGVAAYLGIQVRWKKSKGLPASVRIIRVIALIM